MTDTKTLQTTIDQFLAERRESDGGYAPVEDGDLELLNDVIGLLVAAKWGKDPDGDRPIEYMIVNRTTHRMPYFQPVPYLKYNGTSAEIEAHARATFGNLETATREAALYMRLRNFDGSVRK